MKTKLLATFLAFITINAFSQITVTDNDIVDVGDVINEAIDMTSGSAVQIGPSGANQTWDFSNLQQDDLNQIVYVDPSSTAFGSLHPTSNLCVQDDGEDIYMIKSSTAVEIVGFDDVPLLNPMLAFPLPLTYPMQFSTGPILVLNEIEANSLFPDSLAPVITTGIAHTIDSIKVQIIVESTYDVDGYGDVIIPMGTFPALRLYVIATNTQSVFVYCTDTISGGANSGWYPVPPQLFPTDSGTDYFYQWWSNDPAVNFALVNIDVDEYGYNDGEVQFLTNNLSFIENKNDLQFRVFPIPATYSLIVEGGENIKTDLILRDINGKLILEDQFNASMSLSLDGVAKGIYYLNLKTENGELTKKVIVE